MDISVGDFAESMMARDSLSNSNSAPTFNPTSSHLPTGLDDQAPDISKVKLPDNFISSLLENKEKTEIEPEITPVQTASIVEKVQIDENLTGLLQEVKGLLEDLKVQLNEMTTVGMGGVGPQKSSKKKAADAPASGDDRLQDLLAKIKTKKTRK